MRKILSAMSVLALVACGSDHSNPPSLPTGTITALSQRKSAIETWAKTCSSMPVGNPNCADLGDGNLYAGTLCLAGEAWACDGVKMSQGANGRWWRDPTAVNIEAADSFSRDMMLGTLAYLVATKDKTAAKNWLNFIQGNGNRTCLLSSDDRCDITPNMWGLMSNVWYYLGLTRTVEMLASETAVDVAIGPEAELTAEGYTVNLLATELLIRQKLGDWTVFCQSSADTLASNYPDFPLAVYLAQGKSLNVANLVLSQAPVTQPAGTTGWSFQNQTPDFYAESEGWEYVLMIDLLQ